MEMSSFPNILYLHFGVYMAEMLPCRHQLSPTQSRDASCIQMYLQGLQALHVSTINIF